MITLPPLSLLRLSVPLAPPALLLGPNFGRGHPTLGDQKSIEVTSAPAPVAVGYSATEMEVLFPANDVVYFVQTPRARQSRCTAMWLRDGLPPSLQSLVNTRVASKQVLSTPHHTTPLSFTEPIARAGLLCHALTVRGLRHGSLRVHDWNQINLGRATQRTSHMCYVTLCSVSLKTP